VTYVPNFARILYFLGTALRRLQWSKQKLKEYQEKRLRAVLRHVYDSVPFYHEKFRRAGVSPSDVKSLEDLTKLPITRKDELRQVDPSKLISREYTMDKLKILRTSGSTGKPFKFYISPSEDDWRKSIYLRANISCGQKTRDHWVVVTSPHHFIDTTDLQRKLARAHIRIFAQECVSLFKKIDEQVKLISQAKPNILDGYTGSLYLIAKEVAQIGLKTICPRIVFGTADFVDFSARRYIENTFHAPFYDQFGCAEVDRTAWQCPEKVGYHMDVDSVITQFVDERSEEVSDGERGEIIYTSLFNYAHPFIRYSTEDIGMPMRDECSCHRRLPLMKLVEGRRDSFLILPDGRLLSPMSFWTVMRYFEHADEIDSFRVIQKKIESLEVYVKTRNSLTPLETLERTLVGHIRRCLQIDESSLDVQVDFVKEIPVDRSGRLRSVICELPNLPKIS